MTDRDDTGRFQSAKQTKRERGISGSLKPASSPKLKAHSGHVPVGKRPA